MPNNDLISRKALLVAYDAAHKGPPGGARKLIQEAPTVDAAPVVHGRWTTRRTITHDGEWYCSNCDYEPTVFEATEYCPHCGAKMDGEENASC